MILVDIYVPSIDQTYDFNLDENALISDILDEISEMIIQITQGEIREDVNKLMLCSYDTKVVLPKDTTLSRCHIKTGSRLFIV